CCLCHSALQVQPLHESSVALSQGHCMSQGVAALAVPNICRNSNFCDCEWQSSRAHSPSETNRCDRQITILKRRCRISASNRISCVPSSKPRQPRPERSFLLHSSCI